MKSSTEMKIIITFSLVILLFNLSFGQENPAYMTQEWVRCGGPLGGVGYDIRYNFADPNIWYVTDSNSGFYISRDNGTTWELSNSGIDQVGNSGIVPIFCATIDPHHPDTIWIGTYLTGGIYKSTDGGENWVKKTNGIDPELTELTFRGFTVDPRSSDIVYAMAEVGPSVWGDTTIVHGFSRAKGVVYRTNNGGEDWVELWRGNNLARYCWINPDNPDILYVSTGIFDRNAANATTEFSGGVGILKSIDGGQTWAVLNEKNGLNNLFVSSLYMHPENPDVLLAGAGSDIWHNETMGVYLTENGGETWERVIEGSESYGAVEFSVADPNFAYAASEQAFYRSEDRGHTWQRLSRGISAWGPDGLVVGFPIDIQCDPVDPKRLFVNGYLGGNFLTLDGGETWVTSSKGYTGAIISRIKTMPGTNSKFYVGCRSGIFRSDTGGSQFQGLVYYPEGMTAKFNEIVSLAVDPINQDHVMCTAVDFESILYSYNGGFNWNIGSDIGHTELIEFAPSEPQIVYASGHKGFYVSHDAGDTFIKQDHPTMNDNWSSAMAIHPQNSQTVYVADLKGVLYKTVDGGTNWEAVGNGLPQNSMNIISLAIDPHNPEIMYAGFSNNEEPGGSGVYKSTDGGGSWNQSSSGMDPNTIITSIVVDPNDGRIVYTGGRWEGVFYSVDAGNTWQKKNESLINHDIKALTLSDDGSVLYCGTQGSGVFRLGDAQSSTDKEINLSSLRIFELEQNYPNPFNASTVIQFHLSNSDFVTLKIFDLLGQEIATLVSGHRGPGDYTINWKDNGVPSGIYISVLKAGKQTEKKKMMYLK